MAATGHDAAQAESTELLEKHAEEEASLGKGAACGLLPRRWALGVAALLAVSLGAAVVLSVRFSLNSDGTGKIPEGPLQVQWVGTRGEEVTGAPIIELAEEESADFCEKEVVPKNLTCAEAKAKGKCGAKHMKNKCCQTCDESNCPACVETIDLAMAAAQCSGDDYPNCPQQRQWGKCGESWMKGHCCKTCGRQSCPACNGGPAPGQCGGDDWGDCAKQKKWGKCGQSWMRGHCCKSCGQQSCPACKGGSPSQPPDGGGACTMKVIRGIKFSNKFKPFDMYYCSQWTSGTRKPVIFGHGCCGGNSGQGYFLSKMITAKGFPLISINYQPQYYTYVPALLKWLQQGKLKGRGVRFTVAKQYACAGYSLGGIRAHEYAVEAGPDLKAVLSFGSIHFMRQTPWRFWPPKKYYPPVLTITTTGKNGDGGDKKIAGYRAKGVSVQVLKYPGHHGSYFKLGPKFQGTLQQFLQKHLR